jgi:SAM-dependent methyltransferase
MDRETDQFVKSLEHQSMHALEISGNKWKDFPFASYRSAHYPEYDCCNGPLGESAFDSIIAEQVLEHVQWPYRAVQNAYRMLRPGEVFVVNTPFLVKIHNIPIDCCRWTPLGIKYCWPKVVFRKTASMSNRGETAGACGPTFLTGSAGFHGGILFAMNQISRLWFGRLHASLWMAASKLWRL